MRRVGDGAAVEVALDRAAVQPGALGDGAGEEPAERGEDQLLPGRSARDRVDRERVTGVMG